MATSEDRGKLMEIVAKNITIQRQLNHDLEKSKNKVVPPDTVYQHKEEITGHERAKLMIRKHHFYKTPDGENCMTKIALMTGYGAYIGTTFSLIDLVGYTKPSTPLAAFTRYLTFVGPAAAMGTTYAAVTCMSASLRGKDDQFNHFFGGFAMATILGTRVKSQKVVWGLGIPLGMLCMFLKRAYMEKAVFLNLKRPTYGGFHHYDNAYLGATRPPTTGKQEL